MMFDESAAGLVVSTQQGVFLRRIPAATPRPEGEVGPAVERATREAAALWGLPDFVFRSKVRARGSGVTEIGDVIIAVGDVAAVLQVKAREVVTDKPERERSWLDKRIPKAIRQANGTLRSLSRQPCITLVNERGHRVDLDCSTKNWVPVVVIDHPAAQGFVPEPGAVTLLRRDWEFLFDQLKSTNAVIRYLHRVKEEPVIPLGDEPVRYYEFAAADAEAPPEPLDLGDFRSLSQHVSTPLLPQAPAGADHLLYHLTVRRLLEDIALSPRPPGSTEAEFLDVLAAIDMMSVPLRTELGRTLRRWIQEVARTPAAARAWRSRCIVGKGHPQLIFAASSKFDEATQPLLRSLVSLRHQELIEAKPEFADVRTVGVLLTPRRDGYRLWDTSVCATYGDQDLDPQFRADLEALWNSTRNDS